MSLVRKFGEAMKPALLAGFLALPIIGVHIGGDGKVAAFRPLEVAAVAAAVFLAALFRDTLFDRCVAFGGRALASPMHALQSVLHPSPMQKRRLAYLAITLAVGVPFVLSAYQVSILTTALIFVVLGLGLNIVVGLAGLLDLGYVAFYAVGAYTYALLYEHFAIGFWAALPAAALLAALAGILLGIPVLRLRGDYLAIVTLGFGEIVRLTLENWSTVTRGPAGISGIGKPTIPGVELGFEETQAFTYLIALALTVATVVFVRRLDHSRIGRAWIALREDEIACQAVGIDRSRTKLTAFALGACWAGFVGVLFAAKTSYVNPGSFSFIHSAIILCVVVLGGMGSVAGVIVAALLLSLLPEYLRFLSDYRMLVFGAVLVLMMLYRPGGLIARTPPKYGGS